MSETSGYEDSFLSEARANLAGMNAALLEAERDPRRPGAVDEIFRAAHNIKGMAAMMGRERTAELCHALEEALDAVRKGEIALGPSAEGLFRCFDALAEAVAAVEQGASEPDFAATIAELRRLASGDAAEGAPAGPASGPAASPVAARIDSVSVRMDRLDLLMNLAEELVIAKLRFEALKTKIRAPEIVPLVDVFGRLATEIQYQVTQARLVPVRLIFDRFPRMARDLAKGQGKEVELTLQAGDLEVDRRVAEEIGEALIHLIRNAVDHGLETPERRKAAGKPPQGAVRVTASGTRDVAVIEVEDDGAGLDFEAIARAAADRGLSHASRDDLLRAVVGGLSTKARVTPVSGRGLGLDIVKRKVESLGGRLSVKSEAGKGTAFRLEIPLSVSIIKGLFVEVGGRTYALPLMGVERIVPVEQSRVKRAMGTETAILAGEDIPLLRLSALFGDPPSGRLRSPVVVVGRGREKLGLVVDALTATQDIVLKPLNRMLLGGSRFVGSTISGTGEAILVLDVAALIQEGRSETPP